MNKDINVCLVTLYYYPVFSGATERFRRYAPKLLQKGIRLHVMTILRDNTSYHEVLDGITIDRFYIKPSSKDPSAALLRQVLKKWKDTSHYPDVLQIISHSLQGTQYIWRSRWIGIPCLNTITMSPSELKPFIDRLKSWIYNWVRNLPFNCLVTSSRVVSQNIEKQGVSKKRIAVIPNGVDIHRFKPISSIKQRNKTRIQLGFQKDDEIILFVGFISPRKGVDLLINAWPSIICQRPKARLLLVGPKQCHPLMDKNVNSKDNLFLDTINTKILNSPKPERITFTGEIENVEDYFHAAEVFVLPSRLEGFANVVAEAMASGLPCILTPFKGLPEEFGTPGREFILSSFQSNQLAATIIMLLENQSMRMRLGKAARSWAEKRLNVEISLVSYARLYRNLALSS
jgi:glycosyltransferase involved in cell wall biosynthesis